MIWMLKRILPFVFLLVSQLPLQSQNLWFVTFTGKDTAGISPRDLFTPAALLRREKHGLHGLHYTDYPVCEEWVQAVEGIADSLRYRLRWFNAVTVRASQAQVHQISALPFVAAVEPFEPLLSQLTEADKVDSLSREKQELWRMQRTLMHLDTLAVRGLSGQGIRIAILDAGFNQVDEHPAFDHLRKQNRIEQARDFYSNKSDPYFHSAHGTAVLGCIAGMWEGKPIGAAPEATFFLARTEHSRSEKPIEEDHWLAAMEWADSLGADIISSSLGYTDSRYTYANLDGRQSKVTQAAAMAVRKGMLVVNSIGNEGSGSFHWLGAPADADSVLSVGGSYPHVKFPVAFTSYGPNARGILKPEISAPGIVLSTGLKGQLKQEFGTSFSCPLVTGYAACVMQLHPDASCMEVKKMIVESGHLWPYYDYRLGYGVADAKYLYRARDTVAPTFTVRVTEDTIYVAVDTLAGISSSVNPNEREPFYYHIAEEKGILIEANSVLVPKGRTIIKLPGDWLRMGRLRLWYKGYLWEE